MKLAILSMLLFLAHLSSGHLLADEASLSREGSSSAQNDAQSIFYRVDSRLREGDLEAFEELVGLDPELKFTVLHSVVATSSSAQRLKEHPNVQRRALELMRQLPNHAQYFKDRLVQLSREPMTSHKRQNTLRVMIATGGPEIIRVLGELLHDDHIAESSELIQRYLESGNPIRSAPLSMQAARVLCEIKPSGAPLDTSDDLYHQTTRKEAIEEWRAWWKASGERTYAKGEPVSNPANAMDEGNRSSSTRAIPPAQPNGNQRTSRRGLHLLIIGVSTCVLVAIVGALVYRRSKRR